MQPEEQQQRIEQLVKNLNEAIQQDKTKKALTITKEVLALDPSDEEVIVIRVTLLVYQEKFKEAYEYASSAVNSKTMNFLQAYCQYRLGDYKQALKLCDDITENDKNIGLQLQGQILYKMGNYTESEKVFESFMAKSKTNDQSATANLLAVYYFTQNFSKAKQISITQKKDLSENFEAQYNYCLNLYINNQYQEATQKLQKAIKSGREALLIEDMDETSILHELTPLYILLGVLQLQQDKIDDSFKTFQQISSQQVKDKATNLFIQLNDFLISSLSSNPNKNIDKHNFSAIIGKFEALLKKTKDKVSIDYEIQSKIPIQSQKDILSNYVILNILNKKYDFAQASIKSIEQLGSDSLETQAIKCALFQKQNMVEKAVEVLKQVKVSSKEDKQKLQFMQAQMFASCQDYSQVVEILSSPEIKEFQDAAGFDLSLATLYYLVDKYDEAQQILKKYLNNVQQKQYIQKNGLQSSEEEQHLQLNILYLLIKIYVVQQDQQAMQQLSDALEGINLFDNQDMEQAVNLLKALAVSCPGSIQAHLKKSTKYIEQQQIHEKADIEQLLNQALNNSQIRVWKLVEPASQQSQNKRNGVQKARKKRKAKIPKNADLSRKPDPERWLPKWQRSAFKKKHKNKGKDKNYTKGTQGGQTNEKLDSSQAGPSQSSTSKKPIKKKGGKR